MSTSRDVDYRIALAAGFLAEADQDFTLERWRSCVDNAQLALENAGKAAQRMLCSQRGLGADGAYVAGHNKRLAPGATGRRLIRELDPVQKIHGNQGESASPPGRSPGTFGGAGIFSFNGKEIITTSGGGMYLDRQSLD